MKRISSFLLSVLMLFTCAATFLMSGCKVKRDFLNVIVVIGDGMGENHILNAIDYFGLDIPIFIQDQKGYIGTNSLSGTTDSAAGGTALSTGRKVHNSNLAMINGADLESIIEIAQKAGMKTGVVTTDTLDGATPAAFSAHASKRTATVQIIQSQASSKIDLLLGRYSSDYELRQDEFTEKNFTYTETLEELHAAKKGGRLIGMLNKVDSIYSTAFGEGEQLVDMARYAVEYLENENGFFLMIEGAYIDKNSHSNDFMRTMCEVRSLFDTIEYLYEYASDGKTAIFITADHETGGLQRMQSVDDIPFLYTSSDHTPVPVPLYVKNYNFDAKNFGYAGGVTPENTVVFNACKAIING